MTPFGLPARALEQARRARAEAVLLKSEADEADEREAKERGEARSSVARIEAALVEFKNERAKADRLMLRVALISACVGSGVGAIVTFVLTLLLNAVIALIERPTG